MKYSKILLIALTAFASQLSAQIVVDFNDEGSLLTESGFLGVDSANGNISNLAIGDGISLSAVGYSNTGGRLRNSTGLTSAVSFFRDGFSANNASGKEADFTFSGLIANISYEFTFWTWDNEFNNTNVTVEFFETTGDANNSVGTVLLAGVKPASLSDASTTFTLISDNSGTITLDVFGYDTVTPSSNKGVLVNGFSITAIPEPSVMAVAFVLGCFGLVYVRRSRR